MTDKQLAVKCVQMIETYLPDVQKLPNNNTKMVSLTGSDKTDWQNIYYPQLSKSGKIRDGLFFQNPLKDFRYGIGDDGTGTKLEFLQFLWSAYKFILGDFPANSEALTCIKDCIKMLEPYAAGFENKGTKPDIAFDLNKADMKKWNDVYYPKLSGSGLVPDASFFGTPNLGIGNDGRFGAEELCHFLYRLYRQAYIILN